MRWKTVPQTSDCNRKRSLVVVVVTSPSGSAYAGGRYSEEMRNFTRFT